MELGTSGRKCREMAGIFVILLFVILFIAVMQWYQKRRMYQLIDQMLEQVLNREKIEISDIQEGEISALVSLFQSISDRRSLIKSQALIPQDKPVITIAASLLVTILFFIAISIF